MKVFASMNAALRSLLKGALWSGRGGRPDRAGPSPIVAMVPIFQQEYSRLQLIVKQILFVAGRCS